MLERQSPSANLALQLGELSATVRLQGEANDRRFSEILTTCADTKAQTHEIKHDVSNHSMGMIGIGERLKSHIEKDDDFQQRILDEIRTNREVAKGAWNDAGERMKAELKSHREAIDEKIAAMKAESEQTRAKLDTLLVFRNKIMGAVALVILVVTIFGGQIGEALKTAWHSITSR